jgi:hypothetical protein
LWGSELSDYLTISAAWVESLRSTSVFDRVLSDMRRVPLRSRLVAVTGGASANKVGQLEIKPLTELSLDANSIALRKAVTVVAGSDKLFTPRKVTGHAWRHGPGGGQHAAPRSCSTPLL